MQAINHALSSPTLKKGLTLEEDIIIGSTLIYELPDSVNKTWGVLGCLPYVIGTLGLGFLESVPEVKHMHLVELNVENEAGEGRGCHGKNQHPQPTEEDCAPSQSDSS